MADARRITAIILAAGLSKRLGRNKLLLPLGGETVIRNTQKWFNAALALIAASGVFMSGAVAVKLYYNEMFWGKMAGLGLGILFVYGVRRPLLLRFDHAEINPWALRLLAVTSLLIWFSVAACGRWIGFS